MKIPSINFAHFPNYNGYLVFVGREMGRKMFEMQRFYHNMGLHVNIATRFIHAKSYLFIALFE